MLKEYFCGNLAENVEILFKKFICNVQLSRDLCQALEIVSITKALQSSRTYFTANTDSCDLLINSCTFTLFLQSHPIDVNLYVAHAYKSISTVRQGYLLMQLSLNLKFVIHKITCHAFNHKKR